MDSKKRLCFSSWAKNLEGLFPPNIYSSFSNNIVSLVLVVTTRIPATAIMLLLWHHDVVILSTTLFSDYQARSPNGSFWSHCQNDVEIKRSFGSARNLIEAEIRRGHNARLEVHNTICLLTVRNSDMKRGRGKPKLLNCFPFLSQPCSKLTKNAGNQLARRGSIGFCP